MSTLAQTEQASRGAIDPLGIAPRLVMTACAIGGATILGVAAWLEPALGGIGTHTQLGISPCTWPSLVGVPCPSCGMTTAFACAADGNFVDSLRAQPAGFLLAVVTATMTIACTYAAVTGSRLVSAMSGAIGSWGWWIFGGVILGSWGYKIAAMQGALV